jgi:hypothetical protein
MRSFHAFASPMVELSKSVLLFNIQLLLLLETTTADVGETFPADWLICPPMDTLGNLCDHSWLGRPRQTNEPGHLDKLISHTLWGGEAGMTQIVRFCPELVAR